MTPGVDPRGLRLAEAYAAGATVMPELPVYLALETTSACNLTCIMCPQPLMQRARQTMRPALFETIIDQAAGAVQFAWLHLFGEPLANPHFGDLVHYAARYGQGMRLGTSTNVTLLDGERAAMMAALPLDVLLLSMDGVTAASYEAVRVGGSFAAVVANVEAFARLWEARAGQVRPRHVVVSFIDLPRVREDVQQAERFWRERVPAEFVLSRKPLHEWADQDALTDRLLRQMGTEPRKQPRERGCHELFRGLTVLSDGRCVPCCNDYEGRLVLGDLTRQSLAEVWNGEVITRLRADRRLDNALCRFCPQYTVAPEHATLPISPFQPYNELVGYVGAT